MHDFYLQIICISETSYLYQTETDCGKMVGQKLGRMEKAIKLHISTLPRSNGFKVSAIPTQ